MWTEGEQIECTCGMPAVVRFHDDAPHLLCFFHSYEAGVICRLPDKPPSDWPPESKERLIEILEAGVALDDE